jgi:peptide/nickel transport system substrate-binding protein
VKRALLVALAGAVCAVAHASPGPTLRLAEETAPTLDPALASSPDAVMLQNAICDRLYTTTSAGEVVPQIATGMPLAGPDAQRPKQWTTYTLRLRRSYHFVDGTPVTAYSFADAIARDANPDMGSPALGQLRNIVGVAAVAASEASAVSGVRAAGDDTLQISTMRRVPNLAALLAEPYFCPVQEDTPVAPGGIDVPPSAGPYYVQSSGPKAIVLARDPHYGGTRRAVFARIDLATGVAFDACRALARRGREDICLDALPQHAASVSFPEFAAQGWIAKSVGCLAWQPVVRLDLTTLCRT